MLLTLTPYGVAKVNSVVAAFGVACFAILTTSGSLASAGTFELKPEKVKPATAYFAGKPVRIHLRAADDRERPTRVTLINKQTRKPVRRWSVPTSVTLTRSRIRWAGETADGKIARNGRYVVRAGPVGRPSRKLGTFTFRRHAYPVAGPHHDRGAIGEFGAPRSGGRSHEGFDINANCGTRLVAARGGKVLKSRFDGRLMGNFVVIKGRRNGLRYLYAHLGEPSPMRKGDRVRTGQLVGRVGQTGNAASTPCHLHFELRRNGPIDPEPYLRRWDR